jgi:MBG domain (YGX type)
MRRAYVVFSLLIPAFLSACSVEVASTITPTIHWATPAALTYGTALSAKQLNASASVAGTLAYDPAAGTVLTAGTHTLMVTFTPTNTAKYSKAAASVTLTVDRAMLTVTAEDASRVYGAANPTLTDTITGFVNGDTSTVVSGTATLSTMATTSSPVGTYPITAAQGTLAAANYTFSFVNGTLTVDKATPAITWATPAPISAGTALSATQLDATSSVAGTMVYTPAAGTVLPAGSHKLSVSFTPTSTTDYTTASDSVTLTVEAAGGTLSITTTQCPSGIQGTAYAGCTIAAEGGTPPYSFSVSTSSDYPPLPEGMVLNATTGAITSAEIGGQGTCTPEFVVTDSVSAQATQEISFAISGDNAFLAGIFPSTSIFHHRVDAATTGLPVDASPAAPMYSGYLPETVKPFFGNNSNAPFPNGIPAFEVPYNQPDVAVSTTVYQSYFTAGPIPANAPVEGTSNSDGDRHVLVYLEAGDGKNPALYEMWQGIYEGGPWTDSSNALWPNVASNALTPQGMGTSDAAGLPVAPLLANADEVIGTGTPSAPNGTIQHPIRFTLNHMVNYWVWPATETAGVGSCTATDGSAIPTESEISQSAPPESCTMSGPAGEIYRLKASVATPACAATSPQAAIIITAFRNYGIILADNGDSGGLIGTPDARWNDDDLSCITSLTLGDFEPVNVSSLIVSNDSGGTSH